MTCPFDVQLKREIVYFIDITECSPGKITGDVIKSAHQVSIPTIFAEYNLVEPSWSNTKLPTFKRKT